MSNKFYRITSGTRDSRSNPLGSLALSLPFLVWVMATVALTGCQSDNSANETDSGYRYEIFTDVEGETGNPGDYVYLDIKMIADETEMFDTRDNPNPPEPMRLPPEGEVVAGHMRPIVEVISMLSPGDSAMVEIPIDSFAPVPNQLKQFTLVKYYFAINEIVDEAGYRAAFDARQEELAEAKTAVANKVAGIYADYKSGKLDNDVVETTSGLQYIILEEGQGPQAGQGESVTAQYFGVFAENGEMFDTSWKSGYPFTFTLGQQEVIAGWDEGFALLNKGAKAALFIPSELAYGDRGYPPVIAPNTDLIFYVEVVDIN